MEYMGMAGVAAISVIAWLVGETVNSVLGIVGMRVMPDFPAHDLMSAAAVGIVSGLAATGADQIGKQFRA